MNFVLTHHWYNEIKEGRKKTEYRIATDYWQKRISKLKHGDKITFSKGYTKERLSAIVYHCFSITSFGLEAMDKDVYEYFAKTNETPFLVYGVGFGLENGKGLDDD